MAVKRLKTESINFIIKASKIAELITKMVDLTRINDEIKFKFTNDDLFIYSYAGLNDNIHAFKSFLFKTKDLFSKISSEFDGEITFILPNAKKSCNILKFYNKYDDDIEIKLFYNDDNKAYKLEFKNKKLFDYFQSALKPSLKLNVDVEQITSTMDTDTSDFSFTISKSDFDILKGKSSIEKENEIFYLTIKDKKLFLGENRSSLFVEDVDYEDSTISFPKKYFNTINFDGAESIKIWVFETFILALSETSNLLVMTELTI